MTVGGVMTKCHKRILRKIPVQGLLRQGGVGVPSPVFRFLGRKILKSRALCWWTRASGGIDGGEAGDRAGQGKVMSGPGFPPDFP